MKRYDKESKQVGKKIKLKIKKASKQIRMEENMNIYDKEFLQVYHVYLQYV